VAQYGKQGADEMVRDAYKPGILEVQSILDSQSQMKTKIDGLQDRFEVKLPGI